MSGIAGLLGYRGGAEELVSGMARALAHRGRDGIFVAAEGPTCFGHLSLATTPEDAHETQPLRGRGLLLVADARLDERDALARELGIAPGTSDAALLLGAWERWGERCVEHLLGDFAFALWDAARGVLFAARDPLGMRPLFFRTVDGAFAFASEIKALLTLPGSTPTLDEDAACGYLLSLPPCGGSTLYAGIRRLPAAHVLTVAPGQAPSSREYWRLDPSRALDGQSDGDLEALFRSTFRSAVASRLRAAGHVGASLSGGLDSSSVVCVARELLPEAEPLRTYSLRFPGLPACDESAYIEAVTAGGRLEPRALAGDDLSPIATFREIVTRLDEPSLVMNLHLTWATFRAASADGVRVMLDGHDGDTAVSHGMPPRRASSPRRSVARRLLSAAARPRTALSALRRRLEGAPAPAAVAILDRGFARRTGAAEKLAAHEARRPANAAGDRDHHYRSLTSGYGTAASETLERAGAEFGIEPRHPFYDRRLLELCLALPAAMKRRGGVTRWVLRTALAGTLPELVRRRPDKARFGAHFHRRFAAADAAEVARAFEECDEALAPFVDLRRLAELRTRYAAHPVDDLSVPLWSALTFGLWRLRGAVR